MEGEYNMKICNICEKKYGIKFESSSCRNRQNEMKAIISRLKGGMPPKPSSAQFIRVGREEQERRICNDQTEGMVAARDLDVGRCYYILADFGQGKTFFLNLLSYRAHKMNFVTSKIQITDIKDITNLHQVFYNILQNITFPNESGRGVGKLLMKIINHFDTMNNFRTFSIESGFTGHPLNKMIKNLLLAKFNDVYDYEYQKEKIYLDLDDMIEIISSYISGNRIEAKRLWAIGKKGFDNLGREDPMQYLTKIQDILIELGYSGLVVQIDEMVEELNWTVTPQVNSTLIGLYNMVFEDNRLGNTIFVFVGTKTKWDELISQSGHGGLIGRYEAGRVGLPNLSKEDYLNLLNKIISVFNCAKGSELNINTDDIRLFVDTSFSNHQENLSPRDFINKPLNIEGLVLIDILKRIYRDETTLKKLISMKR